MSDDRLIRRAYRLYVRYQTDTVAYKEIAASLGLSPVELNKTLHPLYVAKKLKRPSVTP